MRLLLPLALLVTASASGQTPAAYAKPQRPIPAIEHVVVIGIDGLRPDRLLLADTPVMKGLMQTGAYSMWMRTTPLAVTLPSFVSMMTGVNPRKHAVDWDRDMPTLAPFYSKTPTIFELASNVGYVTAMASGKSKFVALAKPGTVRHAFYPKVDPKVSIAAWDKAEKTTPEGQAFAAAEKVPDPVVVGEAVRFIEQAKPNVLFVHLPSVDTVGHASGWGSREQLQQIAKTDGLIGQILSALDRAGMRDSTVVIISADHGGAGLTHGPEDPRSRYIPWIINGPGVRKGVDLTETVDLDLRTEDTCATACWLLGLALPVNFDGRPVRSAFASGN